MNYEIIETKEVKNEIGKTVKLSCFVKFKNGEIETSPEYYEVDGDSVDFLNAQLEITAQEWISNNG